LAPTPGPFVIQQAGPSHLSLNWFKRPLEPVVGHKRTLAPVTLTFYEEVPIKKVPPCGVFFAGGRDLGWVPKTFGICEGFVRRFKNIDRLLDVV